MMFPSGLHGINEKKKSQKRRQDIVSYGNVTPAPASLAEVLTGQVLCKGCGA